MTSPGQGTERADVRGFLEAIADMQRQAIRPDCEYAGIEDVVLRHGRYFRAQPLPRGYERMKRGECFGNALSLMLRGGLTYCEGYAVGKASIPVHHAWCLDERGQVVDPTWEDAAEATYYGVPLTVEYVSGVVHEKGTDTVFDWQRGAALFCEPLPEEAIADDV